MGKGRTRLNPKKATKKLLNGVQMMDDRIVNDAAARIFMYNQIAAKY